MFRKIRFWMYAVGFPLIVLALFVFFIARDCRALPDAETQHRVQTDRGFEESIATGMDYINKAAGCKILVKGSPTDHDIRFIGITETPCGVNALHPGIESGHTANAYLCPQSGKWDIDVESPGDIRLMVCIAMHELMHTLGFVDGNYGIMDPHSTCEGRIWPSDAETKQLKSLCVN